MKSIRLAQLFGEARNYVGHVRSVSLLRGTRCPDRSAARSPCHRGGFGSPPLAIDRLPDERPGIFDHIRIQRPQWLYEISHQLRIPASGTGRVELDHRLVDPLTV
jgi:hypothetical protein